MLIDKIIGFFSPESEFKRLQFRSASKIMERGFEGAAGGRRLGSWKAGPGSANTEMQNSLSILRNRSRDLERNNPYAKKAIKVLANNSIGWGIRATINDEYVAKLFLSWAEKKKNIDFNGRNNLYGLQKQALKAVVRDGEVFIRKRRYKNSSGVPLQLQVCEAEFIDTSRSIMQVKGESFIIQGVEFDKNGKRIAYWMYDRHPSDSYNIVSTRVPESEVIHLYSEDRPGQVRGLPWFAAIILRMRDLDEYEDATLVRQKMAACFTAFVTDSGSGLNVAGSDEDLPDKLQPGRITKLSPGQTVTMSAPPGADGYSEYMRSNLRSIAAGLSVTYEAMTGDLSNVNFSSGRMGWLEFSREVDDIQWNLMIPNFCEDIFDWFLDSAEIAGKIPTQENIKCSWTPPRREMIDPVKETKGINMQIRSGLITWSEAVRQQGYDPKDILTEMKSDMDKWDKMGITLDCDARLPKTPQKTKEI